MKELRHERRLQFAPPKTYDYSKPKKIFPKPKHREPNTSSSSGANYSSATANNTSFRPPEFYNNPEFYNTLGSQKNQSQSFATPTPPSYTNPIYQQQPLPTPPQFLPPPPPSQFLPFPPIPPLFMNPPNLIDFQQFNPAIPNLNVPPPSFLANKNAQQPEQSIPLETYETCIIGTSMIKPINPSKVFSANTKCFFNSISGGSIKNVMDSLEQNEQSLKSCLIFVVTCGSNDLDSTYKDIQQVISLYLDLARLLKKLFPSAKLVFNKLVPRTSTRFVDLNVNVLKLLKQNLIILLNYFEMKDQYE